MISFSFDALYLLTAILGVANIAASQEYAYKGGKDEKAQPWGKMLFFMILGMALIFQAGFHSGSIYHGACK